MGASVDWDRKAGTIDVSADSLEGVSVSVEDTPDLLPTIATLGAVAEGDTRIVDAEHVRYKETDRVSAMADELGKLGVETTEEHDSLTVHGSESDLEGVRRRPRRSPDRHGARACGPGRGRRDDDRRAEHVDVSFPGFFDALEGLGVSLDRS